MGRLQQISGRLAGLTLAGVLLGTLPVQADDAALRQRIESRLAKAGLEAQADIQVEADNGRVVLSGATTTLEARRRAEQAARKETRSVENRLKVLPEERSDAEIRKAVVDTVLREPRYSVFDAVGVEVHDGVVTLSGSVYRGCLKDDFERAVGKLAGVREVRNQIGLQSASIFDDRLRQQLARAIYRSDRFVQYGAGANPSIRILVDRGRITLAGWVNSNVDRVMLEHIARGFLSFGVDNQLHVDGEQQKEPPSPGVAI